MSKKEASAQSKSDHGPKLIKLFDFNQSCLMTYKSIRNIKNLKVSYSSSFTPGGGPHLTVRLNPLRSGAKTGYLISSQVIKRIQNGISNTSASDPFQLIQFVMGKCQFLCIIIVNNS